MFQVTTAQWEIFANQGYGLEIPIIFLEQLVSKIVAGSFNSLSEVNFIEQECVHMFYEIQEKVIIIAQYRQKIHPELGDVREAIRCYFDQLSNESNVVANHSIIQQISTERLMNDSDDEDFILDSSLEEEELDSDTDGDEDNQKEFCEQSNGSSELDNDIDTSGETNATKEYIDASLLPEGTAMSDPYMCVNQCILTTEQFEAVWRKADIQAYILKMDHNHSNSNSHTISQNPSNTIEPMIIHTINYSYRVIDGHDDIYILEYNCFRGCVRGYLHFFIERIIILLIKLLQEQQSAMNSSISCSSTSNHSCSLNRFSVSTMASSDTTPRDKFSPSDPIPSSTNTTKMHDGGRKRKAAPGDNTIQPQPLEAQEHYGRHRTESQDYTPDPNDVVDSLMIARLSLDCKRYKPSPIALMNSPSCRHMTNGVLVYKDAIVYPDGETSTTTMETSSKCCVIS